MMKINPLISVILPSYNNGDYLKQSVASILSQSFTDFELIVLDDCSTDNSLSAVREISDKRLKIVVNEKNIGLIANLNHGIHLASGKYIARMDGDDIAHPDRFKIQLSYFTDDPKLALVCSPVSGLSPAGQDIPGWELDIQTSRWEDIRKMMSKTNCIAHPSVMMRTELVKKYKYNTSQKGSEDWDLWMRLISDGYYFVKTKESLLKYRIHPNSITATANRMIPVEKKIYIVKLKFLLSRIFKFSIGLFEMEVFYSTVRTIARHYKINVLPDLMRDTKRVFTISPIKAFRQFSKLKSGLKNRQFSGPIFFFPYCHIGGAERVHADITGVFKSEEPLVFFTGIADREDFRIKFDEVSVNFNVGFAVNHPFFRKKTTEIILSKISESKNRRIFGCNNIFFYEHIGHFSRYGKVIDLIHDFIHGPDNTLQKYLPEFLLLSSRVFISERALDQMIKFYNQKYVDKDHFKKMVLIRNYTKTFENNPNAGVSGELKVIFVGRDTPEKRTELFGELAIRVHQSAPEVVFTAVGDLSNARDQRFREHVHYCGPVTNEEKLHQLYCSHHLICVTSDREGFPMVIMEGMARGVIPVSAPVGDVSVFVNTFNGFVCSSVKPQVVIDEMARFIMRCNADRKNLKEMSQASFEVARKEFSHVRFSSQYKEIFQ